MVDFLIYEVEVVAEDKKDKKDKQEKPIKKASTKRTSKKTQTVRERAQSKAPEKKRRIRKVASKAKAPARAAKKLHNKVVNIPLPNNRFGRILGKRVRIFPKFLVNAFKEIKLVVWPTPKETIRLTIAVFIFAVVFASIVGLLDFGFSKLFEHYIIK